MVWRATIDVYSACRFCVDGTRFQGPGEPEHEDCGDACRSQRLGGVLFVLLAGAGRLSGRFPYLAGWGDFTTGALAIPAAWLAASDVSFRNRLIVVWNTFGTLDLIVAVTLGLTSRNGSPLQLIHAGVGTAALQSLPWAFVPTVLVPFFLVAHAAIFVRLRARSADSGGQRPISIGDLGRAH